MRLNIKIKEVLWVTPNIFISCRPLMGGVR